MNSQLWSHAGIRARRHGPISGPLTVSHLAVRMDDATCLLGSEILEVWALTCFRHEGLGRLKLPEAARGVLRRGLLASCDEDSDETESRPRFGIVRCHQPPAGQADRWGCPDAQGAEEIRGSARVSQALQLQLAISPRCCRVTIRCG